MTSLAIDSGAAHHDEVDWSEPVYEELVRPGGYKMTNASCVRKLFFKNGRSNQGFVVESSESTETRSR